MIKNTAGQKIGAQMISASDGSAFTGSVTVAVTVDAGTQATGTVGSGACTHEGNGYHTYAPSQAETNGDLLAFTYTGSGAIPVTVQVYTVTGDAFARLGAPAGASVSADVAAVKAVLPAALVSGRIDASVGAMASGVVTAAAIASDAITDAKVASDVTIASVTGAVGSVTGNVGGNVTGSVGSLATQAKTDVNAEVDTALSDYDAPTNAEMVARTLAAASYATASGVSAVETDTQDLQSRIPTALIAGRIDATVGAMQANVLDATAIAANAITAAKLAADAITAAKLASDVTDEIWAKVLTEPTGVPAVNASVISALSWLLALSRNRITQTAGVQTLRNDANSADIATATVSDDGSTFVRSEFA